MKSFITMLAFFATATIVYGNTPLPNAYIGVDYLAMTGWDASYSACGSAGCGGEFGGVMNTTANGVIDSSRSIQTNFWCIDAQEDFYWGDSGYANVTPLSSTSLNNNPQVRYSGVTNGGTPGWTYGSAQGLPSSVTARYEMAAWLVDQYQGFPDSIAGSPTDNAIQLEVWDITNNSTTTPDLQYAPWGTADSAWVNLALSCYNTSTGSCSSYNALNTKSWAVVTWATDAEGNLTSQNRQTFLAQIEPPSTTYQGLTPEPGYYAALALLVVSILGAVRGATGGIVHNTRRTEVILVVVLHQFLSFSASVLVHVLCLTLLV